jgi:hypothetical protein
MMYRINFMINKFDVAVTDGRDIGNSNIKLSNY